MSAPLEENPFASPLAEEAGPRELESWPAWNDHGVVVTRPVSALPSRCYACNAESTKRLVLRRSPVGFRGVRVAIVWHLCRRHHRQLVRVASTQMAAVVGVVVAAPLLALAAPAEWFLLVVLGGVAALLCNSVVGSFLKHGAPTIAEASPRGVRLNGAGWAFAESLPNSQERSVLEGGTEGGSK